MKNTDTQSAFFKVLYNNKGYHSMPTYLNVLNNAILRANLPPSKGNPAAYGTNIRHNMDKDFFEFKTPRPQRSRGKWLICVNVLVLQVSH